MNKKEWKLNTDAYHELLNHAIEDLSDSANWGNNEDILHAATTIKKIADYYQDPALDSLIFNLEKSLNTISRHELDNWISDCWDYCDSIEESALKKA